jgi:hypothetical protein
VRRFLQTCFPPRPITELCRELRTVYSHSYFTRMSRFALRLPERETCAQGIGIRYGRHAGSQHDDAPWPPLSTGNPEWIIWSAACCRVCPARPGETLPGQGKPAEILPLTADGTGVVPPSTVAISLTINGNQLHFLSFSDSPDHGYALSATVTFLRGAQGTSPEEPFLLNDKGMTNG